MKANLKGLIAAPFTPMKANGAVNLSAIDGLAESLVANGVAGAFICGTTGESMSLTVAERKAAAERWVAASAGRLAIISHIGHLCLADARELAAHAEAAGVFGIACTSPCYYKPAAVEDLVNLCAEVAAAAPKTPFYYYHIPVITGVAFPMIDFFRAASAKIPTLVGMKFTDKNLMDLRRCLDFEDGRLNIFFGGDEQFLGAMATGARAGVGSTFNFAAPIYRRMIAAFEAGNMKGAQREQALSARVIEIMNKFRGAVGGKAIMKMIGLDCGPSRLPLRSLSPKEHDALRRELNDMDFFGKCASSGGKAAAATR